MKVILVASQKSIRSSQPLRSASNAVVPVSSVGVYQHIQHQDLGLGGGKEDISLLTPSLDAEMHFCFRRMRDCVTAELDVRTGISKQIRLVLEEAVSGL